MTQKQDIAQTGSGVTFVPSSMGRPKKKRPGGVRKKRPGGTRKSGIRRDATMKKKAAILAWPDHERRPNRHADDPEERSLGVALSRYISPSNPFYDAAFHSLLKLERPLWFRDRGAENRAAILAWPDHERRPSQTADDPEERRLSAALSSYISPASGSYDAAFHNLLKLERPLWFRDTAAENKAAILAWPDHERRPRLRAEDPEERSLGITLSRYITPSHNSYDEAFREQLERERPFWFRDTAAEKKAAILAWPDHERRPSQTADDPLERSLGRALSSYISPASGSYDAAFHSLLKLERPLWVRDSAAETRAAILAWPDHERRPNRHAEDPGEKRLGKALSRYITPSSRSYDAAFHSLLKLERPLWFRQTAAEKKAAILAWPDHERRPRQTADDPEERSLGVLLAGCISPSSGSYDEAFREQLERERPLWFRQTAAEKKAAILAWADHERRPRVNANDPVERELGLALSRYIGPSSHSYDPEFRELLERERPLWFRTK